MEYLPVLSVAYAPPIGFFKLLSMGRCMLEVSENFQKQSFRNRCRILNPRGSEDLVVPVVRGAVNGCPIREVEISEHDHWRARHLEALRSAYGKTPFYDYYIDDLVHLYQDQNFRSLFEFDLALIERISSLLHLPLDYAFTEEYYPSTHYKWDFRSLIHPKNQREREFLRIPSYYHRFPLSEEIPIGLSIYDLLFNMGPESLLVLRDCQIDPALLSKY